MSIGGFFGKLGKKILSPAARLGKKVLGKAEKLGNKLIGTVGKGVNFLDKIPILGTVLAPVIDPLKQVMSYVEKGTALAGKGRAGIEGAENLVEAGREAIRTGNIGGVISAGRGLRDTARGGITGLGEGKRIAVGFGRSAGDTALGMKAMGKGLTSSRRGL